MEKKLLQTDDRLLFVRELHDYCGRITNATVRTNFAEQQQVSEKTFINKMSGNRVFKGEEIALVEKLYRQVLSSEEFDALFDQFIQKQCNGDRRTIEAAQDKEIRGLSEVNAELATSKLLV